MARPRIPRRIQAKPRALTFKPSPASPTPGPALKLSLDEWEAVRLHYALGLAQNASALEMRVSQSTFARILDSANKKIGQALAEGKAIRINKE